MKCQLIKRGMNVLGSKCHLGTNVLGSKCHLGMNVLDEMSINSRGMNECFGIKMSLGNECF
jgi:hypothetical protein